MTIDVEALAAPISDEAPAGPDLSYDASRQQIEAAFERSISDDSAGGDDVDWPKTIGLIADESTRTRDLWLPIYLMRAGARAGQIEVVEEGAALLAALVEQLWDSVHPQIEEYGFQGRKGPCESLTRRGEFLLPIAQLPLLAHPRFGRFGGDDFERFQQNGDREDGYGAFRALIEATGDDALQTIAARIGGIADSIRRVDTVMTANAEGDTATNFQPTYEALERMRRAIAAFTSAAEESGDASAADDDAGGAFEASTGGSVTAFSGAVRSREDVARALDAVAAYYARFEPASPVPFALRRAREWISLDFLSVLEDIAPASLEEARRVLVANRGVETAASGSGDDSWAPPSQDDGWAS